MTDNNMEERTELRERVQDSIDVDAVTVEREGEDTLISLFYHEPEKDSKLVKTPLGMGLAIKEPDMDELIDKMMNKIYRKTTPDATDIKRKNGYCIIEVYFLDGDSW